MRPKVSIGYGKADRETVCKMTGKVRFVKNDFMDVAIPDNREAESRKSPEYQGKTAQKLAQYGLKAARRAPQFSKR